MTSLLYKIFLPLLFVGIIFGAIDALAQEPPTPQVIDLQRDDDQDGIPDALVEEMNKINQIANIVSIAEAQGDEIAIQNAEVDVQVAIVDMVNRLPYSAKTRESQSQIGVLQENLIKSQSVTEALQIFDGIMALEPQMMSDPSYVKAVYGLSKIVEQTEPTNRAIMFLPETIAATDLISDETMRTAWQTFLYATEHGYAGAIDNDWATVTFLAALSGVSPDKIINSKNVALATKGEAVIDNYLASKELIFDKESGEYLTFLNEVLNDLHPELTVNEQFDAVIYYAVNKLQLQSDLEAQDAKMFVFLPVILHNGNPLTQQENLTQSSVTVSAASYDYETAVQYAKYWVTRRNREKYPNFSSGGGDCTNFVSQVAAAGKIKKNGSGSCRDEKTTREWYVEKLSKNCGYPWQSHRNWAWSTSWSVVSDFRYYMRDKNGSYVVAYNATNEAVSLLISKAQLGDFIQYDVKECGFLSCSWKPTHSTVVVKKQDNGGYYKNDILLHDHDGAVDKGTLRGKYNTWSSTERNKRRIVWIKMR